MLTRTPNCFAAKSRILFQASSASMNGLSTFREWVRLIEPSFVDFTRSSTNCSARKRFNFVKKCFRKFTDHCSKRSHTGRYFVCRRVIDIFNASNRMFLDNSEYLWAEETHFINRRKNSISARSTQHLSLIISHDHICIYVFIERIKSASHNFPFELYFLSPPPPLSYNNKPDCLCEFA